MALCALSELTVGQSGTAAELRLPEGLRRRMEDLGLIPGTRVTCMQIAPAGSPMAFWIRGAVIALRKKDCVGILLNRDA